jgi:hypothetical protein
VAIATDTYNIGDSYIDGVFTVATPSAPTKAKLVAYAQGKASAIEAGGITVNISATDTPQNVECATDNPNYLRLMAANSVALANPSVTQVFPFPSGNVTLNATQIELIFAAVTAFYISVVDALAVVCTGISGSTITTIAQIEAASWPSNS